MTTIIKGCFYTDGEQIMQAHFSGDMWAVDATDYYKLDDFVSQYDRDPSDDDFTYEHDGGVYYSTGDYSPHHTKNLTLISDISSLVFECDY
jgi:hypothetical protein